MKSCCCAIVVLKSGVAGIAPQTNFSHLNHQGSIQIRSSSMWELMSIVPLLGTVLKLTSVPWPAALINPATIRIAEQNALFKKDFLI